MYDNVENSPLASQEACLSFHQTLGRYVMHTKNNHHFEDIIKIHCAHVHQTFGSKNVVAVVILHVQISFGKIKTTKQFLVKLASAVLTITKWHNYFAAHKVPKKAPGIRIFLLFG